MIWDKLVDRCLLFTDAPGGLLKELLKEGEEELANRLELYDSIYTIEVPTTLQGLGLYSSDANSDNNYTKLPHDFLKDVGVVHKGYKLRKVSEVDFYRKSDSRMSGGTPTEYSITGDFISFNAEPAAGDRFLLHYKGALTPQSTDKVLNILHYKINASTSSDDKVWLDTGLGDKLNGYTMWWESAARTLSAGAIVGTSVPGVPDSYISNKGVKYTLGVDYGTLTPSSSYVVSSDFGTEVTLSSADSPNTGLDSIGSLARVKNYRNIAPVIPERFHKDLCNYAVAIANAKSAPDLYDKYWTKWELNMDRLINEAQDRDLIHNVREEI
jgi:hypothetical protein